MAHSYPLDFHDHPDDTRLGRRVDDRRSVLEGHATTDEAHHVHLVPRDTVRRQVERAGYHIVAERVTALPFEVVLESTGRSRAVRLASRAYHALARLWPEMFAYQFILEASITTLDEEATSSS